MARTGKRRAVSTARVPPLDAMIELAAEASRGQTPLEPFEVAVEHGLGVGIDGGRGPALELAHVREDVRRGGDEKGGSGFAQNMRCPHLVRWIGVGVQETDGDGFDAKLAEASGCRLNRGLIERALDAAVKPNALRYLEPQPARHQRGRIFDAQIEQIVAPLEAHIENVAEAGRRQHAGDGTAALDHRVGDERGAVHDVANVGDGDGFALQQGVDAVEYRFGWVVRRRKPLVHRHLAPRCIE